MAKLNLNTITDVHIDYSSADNFAAGWSAEGCRFHVWFNPKTKARGGVYEPAGLRGCIYKNPAEGIKDGGPGDFATRTLDPDKPRNVEILKHVFAEIDRLGLIAKAHQDEADRRAAAAREQAEAARVARIQAAGVQLLDALKGTLGAFKGCIGAQAFAEFVEGNPAIRAATMIVEDLDGKAA